MHELKAGDTVELTEEAARKSRFPRRRGIVVAVGNPHTRIRVRWDQRIRPEVVHCTLLQHAENADA